MRRLEVSNYTVRIRSEKGEWVDMPYEVKDSLAELILSRDLRLAGRQLLKNDDLARKILGCLDGTVLLEEEEWNSLIHAAETVQSLGRPDVELIRRIFEAPKVEVAAK